MKNPSLHFSLFGKPEVRVGGALLSDFKTSKTEGLLYYLATTGRAHSREHLANLFWGGMPDSSARRNLTKSISVLRRQLEPFLQVDARRLGLDFHIDFSSDIHQFDALRNAGDLEPAADLVRGEFLEGFSVRDAPEFEEWLLAERERRNEIYLETLDALIERSIHHGAFKKAARMARRSLELDIWREVSHRALMLALARSGNFNAALAAYDECVRILEAELGVEPMPETVALFERIQSARVIAQATLPAETGSLIGRNFELTHLQEMLANPGCRLVTITGLGGMGKTRLALAAAHMINRQGAIRFLSGVAFISLADLTEPEGLPLAIAQQLGAQQRSGTDPTSSLFHFLEEKEMLLVLDNFEGILAGAPFLSKMLEKCPDIKLLVTSREPLQLSFEWRLDLEGLPYLHGQESQGKMTQAEQLFLHAAQRVQPNFILTDDKRPLVQRLCQLLNGIPLALLLAAAWLRVMPVSEVVAAVEHGLDILKSQSRDLPERQRSMRAILDATWKLLSDREKDIFAALSVFHEGFSFEAAGKIVGTAGPELSGLVDHGLLRWHPDVGRYSIHEIPRQFAAERLEDTGSEYAIKGRHARYFAGLVKRQAVLLTGPNPREAVRVLRSNSDNIRAAWRHALQTRRHNLLAEMVDGLGWFYFGEALWSEGIRLFDKAAAALENVSGRDIPGDLLAAVYGWLGRLNFSLRASEDAGEYFDRQLALARGSEERLNEIDALLGLTRIAVMYSRFADSRKNLDRAIEILAECEPSRRSVDAYVLQSVHNDIEDNPVQTEFWLRQALTTARSLQDPSAAIQPLINLGYLMTNLGRYQEARSYFEEALENAERTGFQQELGRLLYLFGRLVAFQGDYEEARTFFERCREVHLQQGNRFQVARADRWLGRAYQLLGDTDTARRIIRRGLAVFLHMENPSGVSITLSHLGLTEEAAGNTEAARRHFLEALTIARENQRSGDYVFNLNNLARLLAGLGEIEAASDHVREALRHIDLANQPRQRAQVFAGAGQVLLAGQDITLGKTLLQAVIEDPAATAETRSHALQALEAAGATDPISTSEPDAVLLTRLEDAFQNN